MNIRDLIVLIVITPLLSSCWIEAGNSGPTDPGDPDGVPYEIATGSNLPTGNLSGNSMDAQSVDLDGDGDLDLVIAIEFGANRLLINNGSGSFQDSTSGRLPGRNFDSEDVAVGDFNRDGLPDLFFVSEDNQTNEFYLNNGGAAFFDATGRIPVTGISNAVISADVNGDQSLDILIGNNGQNVLLINNGNGFFSDQTGERLPQGQDITQDLAFADLNGNGLLDIVVANEDDNRILINTGSGFFSDQTASRLPLISGIEETREVDLRDVDGDGNLDIYFSNVQLNQSGANSQDRLLINNGEGVFSDVTSSQLPEKTTNTMDTDFMDIDNDGDWDIITGNFDGGVQIFVNDGSGVFTDETESWIPEDFAPRVMDFDVADFNNDGLPGYLYSQLPEHGCVADKDKGVSQFLAFYFNQELDQLHNPLVAPYLTGA